MIERYATARAWAEWFGKKEGVKIHWTTIFKMMTSSGRSGESARSRVGQVFDKKYFKESDVRRVCSDLFLPHPKVDRSGFYWESGVQYGGVRSLSKALGLSTTTIASRIREKSMECIVGFNKARRLSQLYSLEEMRKCCADLLGPIPQADVEGGFLSGGGRYSTIQALSGQLGVSVHAILKRLKVSPLKPLRGKIVEGNVVNFYPEEEMRNLCKELVEPMPRVDKNCFAYKNGSRFGSIYQWSRCFNISHNSIKRMIGRSTAIESMKCKAGDGSIRTLYSEESIIKFCSQLFEPLPVSDEKGFIETDGDSWAAVLTLSRKLGVSSPYIVSRIRLMGIRSIRGKDIRGRIFDFFPLSTIREACAGLIDSALPVCGPDGFVEIAGVRYGTMQSFARLLGISASAIKCRLASCNLMSIRGKESRGRLVRLYPEPAVREACKDLIERKISNSTSR
jgi:hypothetical protein